MINSRLTAKDRGVILGGIKRAFSRSKYAAEIRNNSLACVKGKRGGKMYACQSCGKAFVAAGINVDHIEPVIPVGKHHSDLTWDEIVDKLWCIENNLQVLCKECHDKKSKEERKQRKKIKDAL